MQLAIVLGLLGMVAFVLHDLTSSGPPALAAPPADDRYLTATGQRVSLDDYLGRYLWVDHAAAWCSYCAPQTATIKTLARRYRDRLEFLTVVTGTDAVMQPPTAADAMQWAERFGLDPERVLARFGTDTLPYHVLYSPRGEVLFQGSGLYGADRIAGILETYLPPAGR